MEIIIPICIMILLFITCSICGYCCKQNKQGVVYGVANPPTVTTHTEYNIPVANSSNVGFVTQAPYPTNAPYPQHIAPYPPAPGAGGFAGNAPYPTMPMPQPGSGAYTAPIPPYPTHANTHGLGPDPAHQLPPSYAEAVTQPPTTTELYSRQSPYNPNYN